MRAAPILLAALIATGAQAAQIERDHLVPEGSVIGNSESSPDYMVILQDAFREAYDRNVKLRYVDVPSFETESVVALKEDDGAYKILTLEPRIQLWAYESLAMMKRGQVLKIEKNNFQYGIRPDKEIAELESTLPKDYHNVSIKRCEAPIDVSLATRLLTVWKRMLLDTRYTQPGEERVEVTDGVAGHFSMFNDFEFLAGWTNYAPQHGKLAALSKIPAAMWDYCAKPDAISSNNLDIHVRVLEALLQPQTLPPETKK